MTATISRVYDNYADAQLAVSELEQAGVASSNISIVANNSEGWYGNDGDRVDRDRDGTDDRAEGAGVGAGVGAGLGGAVGLLTGLGLMAIPGVGPVVAAGWLAATAVGAAAGASAGGLIGALVESGMSNEDAEVYAETVRRGGTLVTARVPDADRTRFEGILDRSAVNLRQRETAYREAGWKSFDPDAPAYTAEDIRRERSMY